MTPGASGPGTGPGTAHVPAVHVPPGVGLVLAAEPATGGWAGLGRQAAEAEAAGAGALWVTDHLFWHRPAADAPAAVALLAAATERCTVGPCVLQLPLRSAVATAKAMAFADDVSGGRVVVGVGAGEHEAEYAAAGLADRFHRRGRLLDEGIDDLRAAWSRPAPEGGDTADGGGDPGEGSFTMAPARVLPVWVGGRSERARRRAVARGDAWIPHLCRPSWFERRMPDLDADLDRAGRDPASLVRAAVVAVSVDGVEPDVDPTAWLGDLYASDPRTFARVLARGSATQVAAEVDRFRRAGAQHVTLFVAGDHPADHLAPVLDALGP